MNRCRLGSRMKVEAVPYNNSWPSLFESERSPIQGVPGDIVIALHHVGSTAIEDLAAGQSSTLFSKSL